MSLISKASNGSIEWAEYARSCLLESEACSRLCANGITVCESRLESLSGRVEQFLSHIVDNCHTCVSLDVGVIVSISNRVDTLKLEFRQIRVCSRLHFICIVDVYRHTLVAVPGIC